MYHRNKVHTDEFWKYELAKHRRTVLDSKTNEDMWKKQLGKHVNGEQEAEQAAKAMAALAGGGSASAGCSRSHSLERKSSTSPPAGTSPQLPAAHSNAPGRSPANPQPGTPVDDHWLEQIKRSTTNDPNQNSQVSNEMKLLALHSLQSSLQMMSMKLPMKPPMTTPTTMALSPASGGVVPTVVEQELRQQPQVERPKSPIISRNPTPPGAAPQAQPQGYLSLLAHLSAQRKAEQNSDLSEQIRSAESDQPIRDQQQRSQSESSIAPYLSDMKEEPAAKRTQMWLAQLGQYKHKPTSVGGMAGGSPASEAIGFQDEIDRNHDELWEEQIAKAKSHPVKSPLEPIEITIVDQENDNDLNSGCKAILPPPMVSRPPTPLSPIRQRSPSCNNVISIKTSAIQRMVNHPRTFSLSLEVNNNNTDPNSNGCDPIIAIGMDLKPRNRHIPVPILPTSRPSLMNPPPVKRGRFLEIPEETEETSNLNPVSDHDLPGGANVATVEDQAASIATEAPPTAVVPASEDSSVLKSLLMDRMMSGPRKRTLSEALKPAEPAKRLSVNGDSDILRRRLLGIKSEEQLQQPQEQPPKQLLLPAQQPQQLQPTQQQHSLPPKPKFQPPTATITSQQQLQKQQFHPVAHLEEPNNLANSINIQGVPSLNLMTAPAGHPVNASHGPIDLRKEQQHPASAAASQQQKNYTQTSVLKHLLYRYTNSSEGLDPRLNKQQTNSSGNTSPESSDESALNSS